MFSYFYARSIITVPVLVIRQWQLTLCGTFLLTFVSQGQRWSGLRPLLFTLCRYSIWQGPGIWTRYAIAATAARRATNLLRTSKLLASLMSYTHNGTQCCGTFPFWPGSGSSSSSVHRLQFVAVKSCQISLLNLPGFFVHKKVQVLCFALPVLHLKGQISWFTLLFNILFISFLWSLNTGQSWNFSWSRSRPFFQSSGSSQKGRLRLHNTAGTLDCRQIFDCFSFINYQNRSTASALSSNRQKNSAGFGAGLKRWFLLRKICWMCWGDCVSDWWWKPVFDK